LLPRRESKTNKAVLPHGHLYWRKDDYDLKPRFSTQECAHTTLITKINFWTPSIKSSVYITQVPIKTNVGLFLIYFPCFGVTEPYEYGT
jgi:hypothetical protein